MNPSYQAWWVTPNTTSPGGQLLLLLLFYFLSFLLFSYWIFSLLYVNSSSLCMQTCYGIIMFSCHCSLLLAQDQHEFGYHSHVWCMFLLLLYFILLSFFLFFFFLSNLSLQNRSNAYKIKLSYFSYFLHRSTTIQNKLKEWYYLRSFGVILCCNYLVYFLFLYYLYAYHIIIYLFKLVFTIGSWIATRLGGKVGIAICIFCSFLIHFLFSIFLLNLIGVK